MTLRNSSPYRLWLGFLLLSTLLLLAMLLWQGVRLGGFWALWLTPDQQGRRAFAAREYRDALAHFEDPAWKGTSAYRSGLYEEAAAVFGRIDSAAGFFNRGAAFMKGREYGKAIIAFRQAVAEAPGWIEARENLELAEYTLSYIERAREQSDTGDESELSADDYTFDNSDERGLDMEITRESVIAMESAEKWMRSVDTETRDFLRSRFALEARREPSP